MQHLKPTSIKLRTNSIHPDPVLMSCNPVAFSVLPHWKQEGSGTPGKRVDLVKQKTALDSAEPVFTHLWENWFRWIYKIWIKRYFEKVTLPLLFYFCVKKAALNLKFHTRNSRFYCYSNKFKFIIVLKLCLHPLLLSNQLPFHCTTLN